jgi:esterase/lipase superfamily enzyme
MLACACGVLSGCGAARLGQFERFAEVGVAYADAAHSRVTVCASSGEVALAVSQAIHGLPRLGDSSGDGRVILPGVDTIDASSVDTGFLSHAYFAECESVITDLHALLREGKPPAERSTLVAKQAPGVPTGSSHNRHW